MPKIVGRTLAEHRERIRSRLFAALQNLLAEQPFDKITMAEIAARAGVGRTAVYNHYPDKDALLLAYIGAVTEKFAQALRARLEAERDPAEQLRIYVAATLDVYARYHVSGYAALRRALPPGAAAHLADHAHTVERVLAGIVRGGMRSGRFASGDLSLAVRTVSSAIAGQSLPADPRERARAVRALDDFLLRGLGADVSEPGTRQDAWLLAGWGGGSDAERRTTGSRPPRGREPRVLPESVRA